MDVLRKTDADVAEKENIEEMAQLELICAGLAAGTSIIDGVPQSKAIDTTIKALKAFNISVDKIPSMITDMIVFVPVKFMVFLIATENFSNPRL